MELSRHRYLHALRPGKPPPAAFGAPAVIRQRASTSSRGAGLTSASGPQSEGFGSIAALHRQVVGTVPMRARPGCAHTREHADLHGLAEHGARCDAQ